MSKKDVNTNNQQVEQGGAYEHAFSSVPESARKSLLSLTVVLAGYPIALSNFVIGGSVGVHMNFSEAVTALIVGNLVLIAVVIITGLAAFKTGLSTSFLSRHAFGKKGSAVFSGLLILSSITWVSMNGDIFARLIKTTFSWWPIPIAITAVLCIALWTLSAVRGYKGLEFISYLGVPAALILSVVGVVAALRSGSGFEAIKAYVPSETMTFSAATSSIVGGWVFGATITPDVCRFGKSKRDVVIAGLASFIVGCFGLQFAGMLVALSTGEGDFTKAMASLGLSLVAFFAAIFCLWTTQDNNIYGASLATQNILNETKHKGKVPHSTIALTVAGIAAVLAALGIFNFILPIIQFLSILIPPVPGLIIAEMYIIKRDNSDRKINPIAIISWILAGVCSYIALRTNFFVPALIGIFTSIIFYVVFTKLFDKKTA
ncbi:MAG TPA: thiamine permease [Clostridiaceae bacterium]|nr:thiamine permease [Clostridiaceae bacterium]